MTKAGNQCGCDCDCVCVCDMLMLILGTCWTTFVFMCKLKSVTVVKLRLSLVTCYMWNAYVDPLEMLNNFCFHVNAEKWVFVIMSHVTCHISDVTLCMSYVKCLLLILGTCWTTFVLMCKLRVFVIMSHVTFHLSHVTCYMSICNYVTCLWVNPTTCSAKGYTGSGGKKPSILYAPPLWLILEAKTWHVETKNQKGKKLHNFPKNFRKKNSQNLNMCKIKRDCLSSWITWVTWFPSSKPTVQCFNEHY